MRREEHGSRWSKLALDIAKNDVDVKNDMTHDDEEEETHLFFSYYFNYV